MKKLLLTLLCIFTLSSWHANAQLTEGFESGVFPPTNWTQEYVSAAVDWSTSNGNANGSVSGSNSGSLNASFVANNYSGNSTRLVTPTLDLSAGASYDLSFYHTQVDWGGDQDVLTVYYKTSAASAWVELVNYPSAVYSWTQRTITLPNISGDYYIAFQGTSGYGRGVTLDDVAVSLTPTCADASATMSAITATGATATWAAANGAASYDWEVVPTGNAQGVGVVASGSGETGLTVSITGLTSGTPYDFLISSDCTTDYASAVSFTTAPGCGDTVVVCYNNNLNKLTELESPGDFITVTFNEGDVESCCDVIFVYDTKDQTGNVLFSGTGDLTGVTATSTTGIISVWMDADGSYSCSDGLGGPYTPISMALTCAAPPSCFAPNTLAISNIAADGAQIDFVSGNTTPSGSYEYELVNLTNSEVADGSTDGTATTNPFTLSGLVENASYEIYIKEICGVGDESDFSSAGTWTQLINVPGCASNFSPVDGATQVNTNVTFTLDAPTTGGTATSYEFFLGTDPAAIGSIGSVTDISAGVSITGLNLSTTYYWQVIPSNAVGSATGCVVNQFTTKTPPSGPDGLTCPAGDESTSQYTESFDAQGSWTGDFGTGNDTWRFTTTTTVSGLTGPSAGQDGSYIYFEASGANTNSAAIVSPLIDLTAIDAGDDAELTFYMHAYGQGMGTLEVGASTSQAGPFTNLLTWDGQIQTTTAADWLHVGLDVSSYTGGNLYIEFKQTGATDYRGDMSIDTMEVVACTEIPSCQIPNTLTATISSGGATTIDWVDSNDPVVNDFDYEFLDVTAGETATGVATGQVATNSLDLTSLVDGNDYSILVRTVCNRGGFGETFSDWSTALSWNQTELPGCATNLSPAEGETVYGGLVTFTWDAPTTGGTATSYDFYYGLNGTVADDFLTNYTTTTALVNFPLGNHNYLIVPKNVSGDAVSCTSVNFTIESTPPLPAGLTCGFGDEETSKFTESFDAQGAWTGDFGGSGGWQFDTNATGSSGTGPTGPQDAGGTYMFYEASSATGSASAVSPVIDLSSIDAGNDVELSFYMHAFGDNMGTLKVGASTSPTGPFTQVFAYGGALQAASSDAWVQVGIDVSAYAGGDLYIEFNNTSGGGFEGDVSIDTMEVLACQLIPDCAVPTDLTATGQTLTTTDLAWTAGGTESFWNIEVYEQGADTSTATPVYTETGATQTSTTATGLVLGDYTAYVQADCGATQAISDASATWIGYANVFELPENGGGFQFGGPWGVPDLKSVPDPVAGTVTLQPNFNTYGDGSDSYWVNQFTGEGNKTFESNTYVQNDNLVGNAITFSGDVSSYTLDAGYTATAFIKVFNADYTFLKAESTPITTAGSFLVTYTNVEAGDAHVQYGYQVVGPNANPADEVALGSIVIVDGTNDGVSDWATTNFSIDYCTSTPSSNDAQGISNVQLGTTDFPTGDVTYADYRDTVVDLELDNTANLQVSFATGYTYGTNVWIDFNDDLVFDTTELVFTGTSQSTNPTTLDASFDIAVDAAQGTHYMRIGTADSGQGTPDPCYSGTYGVTIDMAVNVIIPGSCNDLTIWDGTVWSNGAPTTNSYAHIGAAYATGTNGDIDACSLAINAATTVDALGYVNIDGDINVKSAGSLTVAHTGSVVQVQETATTTNGGAISVLVDTPDLDVLDFMVMGSPMSAETREGVWSTAWNVQDHTTANFNSIAGITGFNFQDTELDDWNLYATGVLSAGEGYLVRPQDSYNGAGGIFNYDFNTGTLNSGVVTQTLGFNATDLESPNMLSNPYASAIDADALLAANPEFDALYFWEHNLAPSPDYPGANTNGNNNYSMDDVSVYNALGGTAATSGGAAPNGAIATGQGFGVFATAAGTATFNNAMRLTTGNTTLRNSPISKDRLWLNVNSTAYNVSGNTLLGFVADATQGVDSKYDNGRVASKVSLYSHIQGSDRGYSIQAREAFEDSMTISLGFSSIIEEVTSYKISLSDFDGEAWIEATPYLVDNQTGVVTNLMEDAYNFTSDMGEYNDRFTLVFENRSLANQDALASSVSLYPNPAGDVVTIASPTAAITMVELRDIRGRLILNKAITSQNVTTINIASLGSALYLVTITTDSGSITSRLIVN